MSKNKNKTTDRDYLFISAMLRAREARMPTMELFGRMLDAPGFSEAAKLLEECGYEDMTGMDSAAVEKAISAKRTRAFDDLQRFVPEKAAVDAFRMRYDYHNAKVLVKAQGADTDGADILSGSGRVSPEKLTDAFNSDDYRFIPATLGKAMAEAKGILARTGNPQLADIAVDKAYFAELLEAANSLSDKFLLKYAAVLIDSANLRTAVRTLRMGRDMEFLKSALIPGGSVSPHRLAAAAFSGEGLQSAFHATAVYDAAGLGAQAAKGGRMTEFELACDNAVTVFLKNAKLRAFGLAPVVAFIAALESELTAVRMILTGRLSGVKSERIRERLREQYA